MMLGRYRINLETRLRLGLANLLRVGWYRAQLRAGIGAVAVAPITLPAGDVFRAVDMADGAPAPRRDEHINYFDWKMITIGANEAPDWFLNPITGKRFAGADRPWRLLSDFDREAGDIKCIWEASRWTWVTQLAYAAKEKGDARAIGLINAWLADWLDANPAYLGPNWKCGQEASIRVLHLAAAARMLGQVHNPTARLVALVRLHLIRIAPTLHYAIGQDNNHGTSEAAALFIGGSWLARIGGVVEAEGWAASGRRWLENRAARLVMTDGSFSQYSVNYHRLMLDTLSFTEQWRRDLALAPFSDSFRERATAATEWLRDMTQLDTGDAPNLGANDGARLFQLSPGYRDYRPSVQMAAALFLNKRAYPPGPWDEQATALGAVSLGPVLAALKSRHFGDGGFAILRSDDTNVYMRFPRFRFRPGHADALHLDLWRNGHNLLRDGGTFSYHSTEEDLRYFSGAESHNTVQFDGRDQMPRVSRFLFGAWPDATDVERTREDAEGHVTWAAGYVDWRGASHRRHVELSPDRLVVTDRVGGFRKEAVLRWRLEPAAWRLDGNRIVSDALTIDITADRPIRSLTLGTGWESRYYQQKSELPVVEAVVTQPSIIRTEMCWPA